MAPNPVTITYGRAWIGSRQVTGAGVRRHGSEKVLFLQPPIPKAVRPVWQQVDPGDYVALSNPLDERVIATAVWLPTCTHSTSPPMTAEPPILRRLRPPVDGRSLPRLRCGSAWCRYPVWTSSWSPGPDAESATRCAASTRPARRQALAAPPPGRPAPPRQTADLQTLIPAGRLGSPNRVEVIRAAGGGVERFGRAAQLHVCKGDEARLITGTGGGWGDPRKRPLEKVRADVEGGYVSAEAGRAVSGRDA